MKINQQPPKNHLHRINKKKIPMTYCQMIEINTKKFFFEK